MRGAIDEACYSTRHQDTAHSAQSVTRQPTQRRLSTWRQPAAACWRWRVACGRWAGVVSARGGKSLTFGQGVVEPDLALVRRLERRGRAMHSLRRGNRRVTPSGATDRALCGRQPLTTQCLRSLCLSVLGLSYQCWGAGSLLQHCVVRGDSPPTG